MGRWALLQFLTSLDGGMRRDDCWLTKDRDASGNLQVDKRAFPDGLEPVIAHVHSKGLCATLTLLAQHSTS